MRLSKSIPLFLLIACSLPLAAANYSGLQAGGSSNPSYSLKLGTSGIEDLLREQKAVANDGATPEPTQAELQLRNEETFQKQLAGVKAVIDALEKRVLETRRATSAPNTDDLDRMNQDISLVDDELQRARPLDLSPLAQVQWSEQADRIFNLKMSLGIMTQRWDSGQNVFGMSFFRSAPPVSTVAQRPAPENYRLRAGDKINVTVLSKLGAHDDHLLMIDTAGNVTLPGAGKTSAVGKTTDQLEKLLAQKIGNKFSQLRVQVTVASMSSIQIQVSGEVTRPGTYLLSGMATVLNALYEAGGPTKSGTFRKISLVRDGEPKLTIDLYDFLMNGSKKQDLPLKDGDLIFVSPVGSTVTVSGEVVRPGRYEPSFPTTLGAILKMAGGAKSGGYLQAVQVERVVNNEYKVLLSQPIQAGDKTTSFALQPGDEITVTSVRSDKTNQVSITGPVKAPGLYGFQEKMRLADLIKMAQGLAPNKEVYGGRADIIRINPMSGTSIVSVNLNRALEGLPADNIELNKLDRIFIYEPEQVIFRPKLVTVAGAAARPGTYKRSGGMKVGDAIAAAGGVLPHAYLERADLIRVDGQEKSVLVRVNLQAALNGDPQANIDLNDRDKLMIYTIDEVKWRDSKVRIEGAVQRPGTYVRAEGMRISDLLFAAGGLLPEAASTVELARCSEVQGSIITKLALADQLPAKDNDVLLQDRDVVTVPAVNPRLRSPEVVYLSGEVANPGPYVLNGQDEKLVDVIKRAGGLTKLADVNGLLFLRQKGHLEKPQQEQDSDVILQKSRMFADKQFLTQLAKSGVTLPANFLQSGNKSAEDLAKPTQVISKESELTETKTAEGPTQDLTMAIIRANGADKQTDTAMGQAIADGESNASLYSEATGPQGQEFLSADVSQDLSRIAGQTARISVNLSSALKDHTGPDNMPLRDGDKIYIPKITNVVTVIGAVLHPHAFAAGEGKSGDYYIARSGGYSQEASKTDVVVVRTNGDAIPLRLVKNVMPGDVIVVPTTGLIDITKKWEKAGTVSKVVSDILSSVFVLTRF